MSRLFSEWNSIPDKLEAIDVRLAQISNELASLDTAKIEADCRHLYRALLGGAVASPGMLDSIATRLVTVPLRREVLTKLSKELEAKLAERKARSRVIAKKLGQKSTI